MEKNSGHKLIFEGVELAGKSSIIQSVYDFLENKYNSHRYILDGCHWFNCDVGIFGTEFGNDIVEKYVEIAEVMKEKNVIFEKLHLSDQIYHEFYFNKSVDYRNIEERLKKLNAKIILCTTENKKEIFENRLKDRINLYSHYKRISRNPEDYVRLQEKYLEKIEKTDLPILKVDLTELPNPKVVKEILNWIGE